MINKKVEALWHKFERRATVLDVKDEEARLKEVRREKEDKETSWREKKRNKRKG